MFTPNYSNLAFELCDDLEQDTLASQRYRLLSQSLSNYNRFMSTIEPNSTDTTEEDVKQNFKIVRPGYTESEILTIYNYYRDLLSINRQGQQYNILQVDFERFISTKPFEGLESGVRDRVLANIHLLSNAFVMIQKNDEGYPCDACFISPIRLPPYTDPCFIIGQGYLISPCRYSTSVSPEALLLPHLSIPWEEASHRYISTIYLIKKHILTLKIHHSLLMEGSAEIQSAFANDRAAALLTCYTIAAPALVSNETHTPYIFHLIGEFYYALCEEAYVSDILYASPSYFMISDYSMFDSCSTDIPFLPDNVECADAFKARKIATNAFNNLTISPFNSRSSYSGGEYKRKILTSLNALALLPLGYYAAHDMLGLVAARKKELSIVDDVSAPKNCLAASDHFNSIHFDIFDNILFMRSFPNTEVRINFAKQTAHSALPQKAVQIEISDQHSIKIPAFLGINKYCMLTLLIPYHSQVLAFLRKVYFKQIIDPLKTLGGVSRYFTTIERSQLDILMDGASMVMRTSDAYSFRLYGGKAMLVDINTYTHPDADLEQVPDDKDLFWEVPFYYLDSQGTNKSMIYLDFINNIRKA